MLEFGNKSIVVREHTVRNNVKSDVSIATKGKTEEEQKTAVKHYNKLKNKVLADSEKNTPCKITRGNAVLPPL